MDEVYNKIVDLVPDTKKEEVEKLLNKYETLVADKTLNDNEANAAKEKQRGSKSERRGSGQERKSSKERERLNSADDEKSKSSRNKENCEENGKSNTSQNGKGKRGRKSTESDEPPPAPKKDESTQEKCKERGEEDEGDSSKSKTEQSMSSKERSAESDEECPKKDEEGKDDQSEDRPSETEKDSEVEEDVCKKGGKSESETKSQRKESASKRGSRNTCETEVPEHELVRCTGEWELERVQSRDEKSRKRCSRDSEYRYAAEERDGSKRRDCGGSRRYDSDRRDSVCDGKSGRKSGHSVKRDSCITERSYREPVQALSGCQRNRDVSWCSIVEQNQCEELKSSSIVRLDRQVSSPREKRTCKSADDDCLCELRRQRCQENLRTFFNRFCEMGEMCAESSNKSPSYKEQGKCSSQSGAREAVQTCEKNQKPAQDKNELTKTREEMCRMKEDLLKLQSEMLKMKELLEFQLQRNDYRENRRVKGQVHCNLIDIKHDFCRMREGLVKLTDCHRLKRKFDAIRTDYHGDATRYKKQYELLMCEVNALKCEVQKLKKKCF